MGCSASTQNPSVIASSDERLVGQPHHRAKRDPLADKHLAGDSPGGREAPFSCSEPLPTPKVSRDGRLQFACLSPALLILDDLLSSEECDGLVALASGGAFARRARQRTVLASRLTCHPLLPGPCCLVLVALGLVAWSRPASLSRHRWSCFIWANVA
jgi:hypothetical protein